jgi:hypothetical protein
MRRVLEGLGIPMGWFGLLLFLVGIIHFTHHSIGRRKSRGRLRDWADSHQLTIAECREPVLTWKGPFPERSASQVLYRVVLEDDEGKRHPAWILCGSAVRGNWVDRVEVRLDEELESPFQAAARLASDAQLRRLFKSMQTFGLRGLLLGPCLGLALGVVMVLASGLIRTNGAVPLLVISVVLGAITGALIGVAGGMIEASMKRDQKPKAAIDEL